jgi:hypothetical protein
MRGLKLQLRELDTVADNNGRPSLRLHQGHRTEYAIVQDKVQRMVDDGRCFSLRNGLSTRRALSTPKVSDNQNQRKLIEHSLRRSA